MGATTGHMTTAGAYLRFWMQHTHNLSLSATTVQRSTLPPDQSAQFSLGIVGFFYSTSGVGNGNSAASGLAFETFGWFSDRIGQPVPAQFKEQRFLAAARDETLFTFTAAEVPPQSGADPVHLTLVSRTWRVQVSTMTNSYDEQSDQLVFHLPGAGPNAPTALLITSFGTGKP